MASRRPRLLAMVAVRKSTLVSHRFIGMREILIYSENMLLLLLRAVKTSANDTNFSNLEAKNA